MNYIPNKNLSKHLLSVLACLFLLSSLPACGRDPNEPIPVGVELWNYTNEDVYLTMSDPNAPDNPDRAMSLQMGAHSGGGGIECCATVPLKWRPGLKVLVDYRYGNPPNQRKHTATVELPPYPGGEPGPVFISVLTENEVEVISSIYGPLAEGWPGKKHELP
jgi:hypothetical protein